MTDHTPWGKLTRRNICFPDTQWAALVKLGKKRDLSVTELLRRAVAEFLKKELG